MGLRVLCRTYQLSTKLGPYESPTAPNKIRDLFWTGLLQMERGTVPAAGDHLKGSIGRK